MVQGIGNSSSGTLNTLNQAQHKIESSLEKISSGKKVNSADDNAAAIAIIERFSSQISGLNQATRNASDGISLTQVAEASLSSIAQDVQRIRELAIQSANGSFNSSDRENLQAEADQLKAEVTRTFEQSNFNGVDLFKSDAAVSFQVGANANETIDVATSNLAGDIDLINDIDLSTQNTAQAALQSIDNVLQAISDSRVDAGALENRFEASIDNLQNNRVNSQDARSRIEDTDVAKETSQLIQSQVQQQSGIAVQSQANTNSRIVLQLLS